MNLLEGWIQVHPEAGFSASPLSIAKLVVDSGITPDRIVLVATGTLEQATGGYRFTVAGTGQRFWLEDDEILQRLLAEVGTAVPVRLTAAVTDWREGEELVERDLYTLAIEEYAATGG